MGSKSREESSQSNPWGIDLNDPLDGKDSLNIVISADADTNILFKELARPSNIPPSVWFSSETEAVEPTEKCTISNSSGSSTCDNRRYYYSNTDGQMCLSVTSTEDGRQCHLHSLRLSYSSNNISERDRVNVSPLSDEFMIRMSSSGHYASTSDAPISASGDHEVFAPSSTIELLQNYYSDDGGWWSPVAGVSDKRCCLSSDEMRSSFYFGDMTPPHKADSKPSCAMPGIGEGLTPPSSPVVVASHESKAYNRVHQDASEGFVFLDDDDDDDCWGTTVSPTSYNSSDYYSTTNSDAGVSTSSYSSKLRRKFRSALSRQSSVYELVGCPSGTPLNPVVCDYCSEVGARQYMEDTVLICKSLSSDTIFDNIMRKSKSGELKQQSSCTQKDANDPCENRLAQHQLFGVFDGHGGIAASRFARTSFPCEVSRALKLSNFSHCASLQTAVDRIHSKFRQKTDTNPTLARVGTTMVSCLIDRSAQFMTVCWLGDSEVCLFRDGVPPIPLVQPHKPLRSDEQHRVEASGGVVVKQTFMGCDRPIGRINGVLAVSRAIGDSYLQDLLSTEVECVKIQFVGNELFAVMGSDGLWDATSPDAVLKAVTNYISNRKLAALTKVARTIIREKGLDFSSLSPQKYAETCFAARKSMANQYGPYGKAVTKGFMQGVAKHLVNLALKNKTSDNTTVVVLLFYGGLLIGDNMLNDDMRLRRVLQTAYFKDKEEFTTKKRDLNRANGSSGNITSTIVRGIRTVPRGVMRLVSQGDDECP